MFTEQAYKNNILPSSAEISIKAYDELSMRLQQEKAGITSEMKAKEQQERQAQELQVKIVKNRIVSRGPQI